jgi:geranylgeranyl pyrophosphate synthase
MMNSTETRITHPERIENLLADTLSQYASNSPLYEAMCYSILGGGKRIRPVLMYTIASTAQIPYSHIDKAACAIELLHGYTLIHDDLPAMDDDDLRRGKPSCHIQFGEAEAILVGDALQALAFQVLAAPQPHYSPQTQLAMLHCLAQVAGPRGIIAGQARDLAAEGQSLTIHQIEQIHQEKTASLFEACVALTAYAGNLSPGLSALGRILGQAFQLQDDLLEQQESTATLGKSCHSDQRLQKATHAGIIGIEAAEQHLKALYTQAIAIAEQRLPQPAPLITWIHALASRRY